MHCGSFLEDLLAFSVSGPLWEGETLLPLRVQARLPGISHFAVASCCWWTENRRKIKRSKCQQGSAVHSAPLHLLSGHLEQRVIPKQSCPRRKVGVEVETLPRMQACGIVTESSRISLWSISTCRGWATFHLDFFFKGYCVFLGRVGKTGDRRWHKWRKLKRESCTWSSGSLRHIHTALFFSCKHTPYEHIMKIHG